MLASAFIVLGKGVISKSAKLNHRIFTHKTIVNVFSIHARFLTKEELAERRLVTAGNSPQHSDATQESSQSQ